MMLASFFAHRSCERFDPLSIELRSAVTVGDQPFSENQSHGVGEGGGF